VVAEREASELIGSNRGRPKEGGRCANCEEQIGVGDQQEAMSGYCYQCGTHFSFEPPLSPGARLDNRYHVVGCIARGGMGWTYLASDSHVDGRAVVLKGVINVKDPTALRIAEAERRYLTDLRHDDIVGIIDFVTWTDTSYIVMECISGVPLSRLLSASKQQEVFGRRLELEHIATYGVQILQAMEYLHSRGLLYCDMKPANVIHLGDRVKIIDMGGVRRTDDQKSPAVYTEDLLPRKELFGPGEGAGSSVSGQRLPQFSRLTDLFTVARTLELLEAAALPGPAVARDSFRRLIKRATTTHRAARFGTAAEMAEQLRGIGWESRALSSGKQHAVRSAVFPPGDTLLDAGLGAPPPAEDRLRPATRGAPLLDTGLPSPREVALGLPEPLANPDNPAAAGELRRCLTLLEKSAVAEAEAALIQACQAMGESPARHDWLIAWACGLLLLAGDGREGTGVDVRRQLAVRSAGSDQAQYWFDAVYDALPGEPVPKLALALCKELTGDRETADGLYRAVWERDRSYGSAAFGVARICLERGDRSGAVKVLDEVPEYSPHRRAARIAAVRTEVGRLQDSRPTAEGFARAERRLAELLLDGGRRAGEERARLTAELRESALHWVTARGSGLPAGELFGDPPDETRLRALLEQSLRELAHYSGTREEHGALIDRANEVRPMTLR
jgi:serine/threonine-protein kinase PknG